MYDLKIGDKVFWHGNKAVVVEVNPHGYYGRNVTVRTESGSLITTTPELDPSWGKEKK